MLKVLSQQRSSFPSQVIQTKITPFLFLISTVFLAGESGAMSNMRKSLPASMRSRRTRREITIEDMRTRTPSRELINNDINGLVNSYTKPGESPLVNGNINHTDTATSSLPNGETNRYDSLHACPYYDYFSGSLKNTSYQGEDNFPN